jgi:glycosyltransferase involved in cell wall biosynthesis
VSAPRALAARAEPGRPTAPRLLIVATTAVTLRAFLLPFARHFRALGWRVDGLAEGAGTCAACAETFDRVHDIAWSRNPLDVRNVAGSPRRVRQLVAEGAYDIVHVHTPVASFVTRSALRRARRGGRGPEVVYTAHGFHFHPGGGAAANVAYRALERLAGRWTDRLIVINRVDEDAARRHALVPPSRLRYVPGIGVDTRHYAPAEAAGPDHEVRGALGIPADAPFFAMVAEFNPGKRHADAVAALAAVARRDVHLVFAGRGPMLEPTRARATSLGVGGRVHFAGQVADVRPLVRAAAALLLPSLREGLPRSVLEAMAMERPVIGSDVRGMSELLSGGAGLLHPPGDVAALSRAMETVLADESGSRAMAERGRRRVCGEYALERILSLHQELYGELLVASVPARG